MSDSNIVSYAPAYVSVSGKTAVDRKMGVLRSASGMAQVALISAGGKVGKAAAVGVVDTALKNIAMAASVGNLKPAAEFFAGRTGKPMVLTNRASFESLPDQFEAAIMSAKAAKNGGYTVDKKTGALKPTAALALAMELKSIAVDLIANAQCATENRRLARAETTV